MSTPKEASNQNILNNNAGDSLSGVPIHIQAPTVPAIFADDVENRLGRANGNVYISKPGVDQVHDGQIMVRLKKKRFIIIDYGMAYESVDKKICNSPNCNKIGAPVLLFDSVPTETPSLYMRSGLCFTCQRLLNEKRRTQRKRKSDDKNSPNNASVDRHQGNRNGRKKVTTSPNAYYGSNYVRPMLTQTYKIGDQIVALPNNAIIISGPLEGTKLLGPDYTMKNISNDIRKFSKGIVEDTDRLFTLVEKAADESNPNSTNIFSSDYTAAVSTKGATTSSKDLEQSSLPSGQISNTSTKVNAEKIRTEVDGNDSSMSIPLSSQVDAMYEKALITMKKSIFLLSQWKSSWDSIEQQRRYQQHQQELHNRRLEQMREISKSEVKQGEIFDQPPLRAIHPNATAPVENAISSEPESSFIGASKHVGTIDTNLPNNMMGSGTPLDESFNNEEKEESNNNGNEIFSVQV